MKKIIKLTESDLTNIVKKVIKENETEYIKLKKLDDTPILTIFDLVNNILYDISMKMSDKYDLPEFDLLDGDSIPDYLLPYLDEMKDLVKLMDKTPIYSGVYDAVSNDKDIQKLINRIVLGYNQD
jgi:hypothetical protein